MFVVFDLDGTLANHDERNIRFACPQRGAPHLRAMDDAGWDEYFLASVIDTPHRAAIECLKSLCAAGHRVNIWTGRGEVARQITEDWLIENGVPGHVALFCLVMRPFRDTTPDTTLKAQWAEKIAQPDLVFEDRNRMVAMWRARGVPCFQVEEANF